MDAVPPSARGEGPLLATKFYIPRFRPGQLPRPHLVERLVRSPRRLTVLSAPPGFGKTSLLAEWAASLPPRAVAWLSLDEADIHPATFWGYTVAALGTARSAVAQSGAIELLESPRPPLETVLTLVLNAVGTVADDLWFVLDDYHLIEDEAIQRGIAFLVENAPPQLHLVLATRTDPALPLPRLRTRGELVEIRAADLRLTLSEATAFLTSELGFQLEQSDIAHLEARTEGWVGALQLVALSLQGRTDSAEFIQAFSGDDRYIVDYLVEEVLQRQTPAVRDFLLRTSILERLSAPLCDAVTDGSDSRHVIEALERNNLFLLPLDNQRRWFRYHSLFADVLQAQLGEQSAGDVAALHRRASNWYAANQEPDRAIRHALASGDVELAAGIIECEAETVERHHHPDRLVEWLKPIPAAVVAKMPVLGTYHAQALQGLGDMEGSKRRLDEAERAAQLSPPAIAVFDTRGYTLLPALMAVTRGYLSMTERDAPTTVELATRALRALPEEEHHWRATAIALLGLAHWINGDLDAAQAYHAEATDTFERAGDTGLAVTSAYHDAELLKARGRLTEARRRLETSLTAVMRQGGGAARGAANLHLGLSELWCELGDLAAAERELERASELGIFPPRTPFRLRLARARIFQCRGEFEAAAAELDQAERLQVAGAVPDYRPVAAWRARIHVQQGRLGEAEAWARLRALTADDRPDYATEYEHLTLARLLLAQPGAAGLVTARRLLEALRQAAEASGRTASAMESRMLLARAYETGGQVRRALEVLTPALLAAEPEGFASLFLDGGPAIERLLTLAASRGVAPAYCRRLLALRRPPPRLAPTQPGADSLTEREWGVLRLLATELSGPEIADQLVVSLNTVRTHTRRVYAKLGVNSRRAAVHRAAELGLL